MPVELVQITIWGMFFAIWAMIGHFKLCDVINEREQKV